MKNIPAMHIASILTAVLGVSTLSQAATIVGGSAPVVVGNNFTTAYGADGYILFNTTNAGTSTGNYSFLTNIVSQANAIGSNVIVTPSYLSAITGITNNFNSVAGYGYPNIIPGKEAGLSSRQSSGSLFTFTLGTSVPSTITFGILTNYSAAADQPISLTLSSGAATATDTVSTTITSGADNLFTITGGVTGDVFTISSVNGSNGYIAGATFDSVPEPSPSVLLTIGLVALGGLAYKANRRFSKVA